MIRSPLRAGLALACALSLSACGGGDGDVFIGGNVSGVTKAGLVLTNNDGDDLAVEPNSTSFFFATRVETDAGYNVKVKSVPPNVDGIGNCVVSGGSGKAVFNITTVQVFCNIRTHKLSGNIIGLGSATGLELVNGSDRQTIAPTGADPQTFNMAPVTEDLAYGVTILRQPAGRNCAVENGTGNMREADIGNVVVRCTQ
ncbi:hypothetical protein ACHAC9_20480 [Massilia sp. CMS3.1]|uniref:hypothetical protein n=1 Tax=Massilia sp. CMS3.1 TaxID=3373083 RepID=UPI003EE5A13C